MGTGRVVAIYEIVGGTFSGGYFNDTLEVWKEYALCGDTPYLLLYGTMPPRYITKKLTMAEIEDYIEKSLRYKIKERVVE